MAIAVSPQFNLPLTPPDYLRNMQPSASIPRRTKSSPMEIFSPGGSRRVTPGQQFGRYQQQTASGSSTGANPNDNSMSAKSSSTLSLEELAALLSSSPEDHISFNSSPPARSKGFYTNRPNFERGFRKSQSFPKVNPPLASPGYQKLRPKRRARSVKFADTEGLPLVSVHKLTAADPFQTEGEIVPKILTDLGSLNLIRGNATLSSSQQKDKTTNVAKSTKRKLHFTQPGTQPDFYTRLQSQTVGLESVSSQPRAIHGIVRVMNIHYDKDVSVRWTHDKWRTNHDSKCTYCPGSSDGQTDRFSFTLPANGDDIEFAINYRVQGMEFWDNNNGQNYLITVDQ